RRPQLREARTVVLPRPPPPPPRDRRGMAYGIAAFLCIAALGGAAGYAFLQRRGAFAADIVPIERASVAPRSAEPVAESATPQLPVQPIITAKGELVLLIRPWARVEVDGQEIGVTPLNEPLMLAAGEHTVRLVNPDLGKDITRTVRITASGREVLKELLDE